MSARLAAVEQGPSAPPPAAHVPSAQQVVLLTALAMGCFAGNSLLCRVALRNGAIDASSFTAIRLGSAALVMGILARLGGRGRAHGGSWASALALAGYAIAFSLAYVRIGAGLGALLLFGAVQLTMVGWGLLKGERPSSAEWSGLVLAGIGLLVLTHPSVSGAPVTGIALMLLAGVGWGIYSLRGRRAADPLQTTAANFARTVPLVALLVAIGLVAGHPRLSGSGVAAAVASGALTSGVGYVLWYRALAALSALQAASVQLSVPVLAAAGGVILLGERLTLELVGAAALVLGGLAVVILGRTR